MNLLITGHLGFIGSNHVHYVLKNHPEYRVVGLDKLTYAGNPNSVKDVESNPNYKFVHGDICDNSLVDELVRECDAVVHFAAETHVDRSITGPDEFIQTNVVGTHTLLKACVKHKKRFHHVSSDEVFGFLPLESAERFTETSPYNPSSPYSASKAAADHLVRAYHRTFGLEATITNCSNNYGPFQNPEKFLPLMIIKAMGGKKLPVYGDGKNVRDWIHVEDHCAAIDLVLHKGRIGQTYLVGGNAELTNLEVVDRVLRFVGRNHGDIDFVADRLGHDLRYAVDSTKIEKELGWTRKHDFETGFISTFEWYRDNEWWWKPLL